MRFLARLYVDDFPRRLGENLPPHETEVIIPFSPKHSAPLGGIWKNYSTYCRAIILRLIERIFGISFSFPFVVKPSFKVFFRSNKKFLQKAFLKTRVAVQNSQRSWYRVAILNRTN